MPTPSKEPEIYGAQSAHPRRSIFGNYKPGLENQGVCQGTAREGIGPHSLQEAIDVALARSFIHRYIAQGFENPSRETWMALTADESQAALFSAGKALGSNALLTAADALRLSPQEYEAFESDYITCFGHTVRGDCPMNEIEYGDIKADPLFQPHRLADLCAFYAAFGLELVPDAAERQDHISIELEFMSVLAAKEAYALEHQFDFDHVSLLRDAQKKFLREHLARWTPAFTRRLSRIIGETALGTLADFTREFILRECAAFGVAIGSEDLLLRPIDEASESLCASCGIHNLPPGATRSPTEG